MNWVDVYERTTGICIVDERLRVVLIFVGVQERSEVTHLLREELCTIMVLLECTRDARVTRYSARRCNRDYAFSARSVMRVQPVKHAI